MLDRPGLHVTPEMVLGVGWMLIKLRRMKRRERNRFIQDMDEWMKQIIERPTSRVIRLVSESADPFMPSARAEAAAWWSMVREAAKRDIG